MIFFFCIVLLLLSMFSVSSETFSVDPCEGTVSITSDISNYYMSSPCFNITFPKAYSGSINFYDKYNKGPFDLKLYTFREYNSDDITKKKDTSIEGIGLTASLKDKVVVYTSADGNIKITYTIIRNKVKAGLEIKNWISVYPISTLKLRTRTQAKTGALASFINLPSMVDGIEQKTDIITEVSGDKTYYEQTLYSGTSFNKLIIDPLYYVDYSPNPGNHLISGDVSSYDDSRFNQMIDITSGMSDDNSSTSYYTQAYTTSKTSEFINYTDGVFEVTDYLQTVGDIMAVDFDLGDKNLIDGNLTVCYYGSRKATTNRIAVTINNTQLSINISVPTGTTPNTWTCVNISKNNLVNGMNRIGYKCLVCDATNKVYLRGDTTQPNLTSYFYTTPNWTSITDRDYGIKVMFNRTNYNYLNGTAISGKWSQTYDAFYNWFLRVKKETLGSSNITVYVYYNLSSVNQTQYTTQTIDGQGWFNINVGSLMNYEKNSANLNYTALRFFTNILQYFSEVQLRKQYNDTTLPNITNCQINDSFLVEGEIARLSCNVTDDLDVDYVNGTIGNVQYDFVKCYDWYSYDYVCSENNSNISWSLVEAVDIVGNYKSLNTNITFSCCMSDWEPYYGECLYNDSEFVYYIDNNNCGTDRTLPSDNGTYVYCNYCSEDITGPFYNPEECPYSETQIQYYTDNNYDICCNVTGLYSDCSILYLYTNETINCTYLEQQITILTDEKPYLNNRNYFIGKLNMTDNSTKCWSYVSSIPDKKILQTNPQKTEYSTSLLFRKEEETREYFTPVMGTINAYYTKQNLIPYEKFVLGLKCACSDGTIYNGEKFVTPQYQDLRRVVSRSVWSVKEMSMLIILLILILFVIFMIIYAWKK